MLKYPKLLVRLLPLFLGITFLLGPVGAQEKKERIKGKELDTYLVRIMEKAGIFPKKAKVKRGTTVIWANTTGDYVELFFIGKQIEVACESPVNFIVNPTEGGFYSGKIPPGAVASLCFIEEGTFEYTVVPSELPYRPQANVSKEIKGTIIVD